MSDKEKKDLSAGAGDKVSGEAASKAAKSSKKSGGQVMKEQAAKTKKWFRELKSELKKVVWPSKKQVINNTGIVLAVIVAAGTLVTLLDLFFEKAILNGILKLVTGF